MINYIPKGGMYADYEQQDDYNFFYKNYLKNITNLDFFNCSPLKHNRSLMVKNLKDAASYLKFSTRTLHLAVYLLDIYMDRNKIENINVLLLDTAAIMHQAAKFEETQSVLPKADTFMEVFKLNTPKNEFLNKGRSILKFFNFKISYATPITIVTYFMSAIVDDDDCELINLTRDEIFSELKSKIEYYLNKSLDVWHYLHCFKPSIIAAAIIGASRLSIDLYVWTEKLVEFTGFQQEEICEQALMVYGIHTECIHCKESLQ